MVRVVCLLLAKICQVKGPLLWLQEIGFQLALALGLSKVGWQ